MRIIRGRELRQAALDGPDWASRMVMFRVYCLGLAPQENARHILCLSELSWWNWSEKETYRNAHQRDVVTAD
jgi:hypothetical protein